MKLFYRKLGQGSPFIILHGLHGVSDNWVSIGRALSAHFEVWIPDMRNHGRSPHSRDHDYNSMASDILQLMNDHQIQKAVVLGHSMGGKAAMNFALQNPSRVSHLIVVDIAPKAYQLINDKLPDFLNNRFILETMLNIDFTGLTKREQLDNILSHYIKSSIVRQFILKNIRRNDENKFEWTINIHSLYENLQHILDGFAFTPDSPANPICEFPVLFIKGATSNFITRSDEELIKQIFPGADFVNIPDAGHWLHVEQPELLVQTISHFLG